MDSRAETIPSSWYHDDAVYQRERREIFGREWQVAGFARDFEAPGAALALELAGWPVFVVRTPEGALAGFHNVCRHRAGPIFWPGRGTCGKFLQCRYHGWVYDMAGALVRTPDFGDAANFDRADYGLVPIRVESWRGLVFVNLDRAARPLAEALAPMAAEIAPFPLERFRFQGEASHEIACNWKTYVDNYMEGYHIPLLHPGLHREIDMKGYRVLVREGYCVHEAPSAEGAVHEGKWLWRFPNVVLNIYAHGMNVERIQPLGPRRTRLDYAYFFRDDLCDAAARTRTAMEMSAQVTQEDAAICEAVQRNLEAGTYDTGRLSPRHENGVWHFQSLVRRALGG